LYLFGVVVLLLSFGLGGLFAVLVVGCDVQGFVDFLWNRLDFGTKFRLNFLKVEPIIVGDEVDGNAQVTVTPRPTNPMQICLTHLGEVKVYHDINSLDVYSSCEQVRTDQVATMSLSKIVKNTVPVCLIHSGVNVVACVAQVGNFLGKKFDMLSASLDSLNDLQHYQSSKPQKSTQHLYPDIPDYEFPTAVEEEDTKSIEDCDRLEYEVISRDEFVESEASPDYRMALQKYHARQRLGPYAQNNMQLYYSWASIAVTQWRFRGAVWWHRATRTLSRTLKKPMQVLDNCLAVMISTFYATIMISYALMIGDLD